MPGHQSSLVYPAGTRISLPYDWSDWASDGKWSDILDSSKAGRPYEHWHLAVELNTPDSSDIHRGTAVLKLWNAVEARVRNLQESYKLHVLKKTLGLPRNTEQLEFLNTLGLIRPLILQQLKNLRNKVEHQDTGAPTHIECTSLIDSVWYFLRSTDPLVLIRHASIDLVSAPAAKSKISTRRYISLEFNVDNWKCRASGLFNSTELSVAGVDDNGGLVVALDTESRKLDSGLISLKGIIEPRSILFPSLVRDYFGADYPRRATTPA